MDIVFDQSFRVKGADLPYRHSFSQVIYVMEDIDAASQVVLSREHKKPEAEVNDTPMVGPLLEDGTAGVDDDTALLLTMLTSLTDTGGGVGTSTEPLDGFGMDSGGWLTVGKVYMDTLTHLKVFRITKSHLDLINSILLGY